MTFLISFRFIIIISLSKCRNCLFIIILLLHSKLFFYLFMFWLKELRNPCLLDDFFEDDFCGWNFVLKESMNHTTLLMKPKTFLTFNKSIYWSFSIDVSRGLLTQRSTPSVLTAIEPFLVSHDSIEYIKYVL